MTTWTIYSHLFHKITNSKRQFVDEVILLQRFYFFSIRVVHLNSQCFLTLASANLMRTFSAHKVLVLVLEAWVLDTSLQSALGTHQEDQMKEISCAAWKPLSLYCTSKLILQCGLTCCDRVDPGSKSLSMKALMWELFSHNIYRHITPIARLLLPQCYNEVNFQSSVGQFQ